mmetsp:Transcript_5271/g.6142  ORF Transcript_5271/g.6142 Transcript_5271/m.6142 type:complete len:225 (-) Transcript_5271:243-917(-)
MTKAFLQLFLAIFCVTVSSFTPSLSLNRVTKLKGAESEVSFGELDGSSVRVGIIKTRWNEGHVSNLVEGARKALKECNVTEANIFETEVPGSFELPLAAKFLAMSGTVDVIITAGVLIKGDTMHFEYICDTVSSGLMTVGLSTNIPVIFGVLTCLDENQVIKRSSGDSNHGYDWGKTAVEMATLRNQAVGLAANKGTEDSALKDLGFNKEKKTKETGPKKKVFF